MKSSPLLPTPKRIVDVARIVMVASGKGGVGKSTIAANLAVGLARRGLRTGLLDLDLFGPSIPRLMGLVRDRADRDDDLMVKISNDDRLCPAMNYGVQCMSMGLLVDNHNEDKVSALAWRGLIVTRAIQQLLWRVAWSLPLDWLILDMPPGTGDTQLTVTAASSRNTPPASRRARLPRA